MTTPFYIQRGEMRNQTVWFLTLFLFWLKFDCSRQVTDLSCAASVYDQVAACDFGLQPKMCRHGANTAVLKNPKILDRITFNGMQGTNQALKSKLVLEIPLFFLLMVTDHLCTPQHLMIR